MNPSTEQQLSKATEKLQVPQATKVKWQLERCGLSSSFWIVVVSLLDILL